MPYARGISTTACVCKTVNTNSYHSSCRTLRTWPRATPNSLPNSNPVLRTMSLITLMQPQDLGTIVTKPGTLNPQSLPDLWDETENPHPCQILQGVLGFSCVAELALTPPKSPPTTKHPSTTNQARQLSTNHVNAPRNFPNTSKFSNKTLNMTPSRKTSSGDPTSKFTRGSTEGVTSHPTTQQQTTHEAWM